MGNHLGPALQIGQPANGAVAGKYQVKFFVQLLGQVVHIAAHKLRIGLGLAGQLAGQGNGGVRQVDPRYLRPHACQRNAVLSEMALQMQYPQALYIAQQVALNGVQCVFALQKSLLVVEVGMQVYLRFAVPGLAVQLKIGLVGVHRRH